MNKILTNDIKKIKTPEGRILIYILIFSCSTLFGLLMSKGNSNEKELKIENQNLKQDKKEMQRNIDSLQLQRWKDKSETVEELRSILKAQDSVKNTLKKL